MTHPTESPGSTPDAPSRQAVIDHLLTLDPEHATVEDVLTSPAAGLVVAQARTWIANGVWADLTADQVPDLADHEVLHGITAHWGTLSALIDDLQAYARHDPAQLDHHLTTHAGEATTAAPGTTSAVGAQTPGVSQPRPGDLVRLDYDDSTAATGVWALDEHGRPGVADDGGLRSLDPSAGVVGWEVVDPDSGQGLVRAPYRYDPDYQASYHPQELSDAYDRGDGPAGLTYSQYVAWADGPGLPQGVLDAAAAEAGRTQVVLDWWDARADVLADLAAPAREHHPAQVAEMDDEQAATWHAHHDPAGVPALVEPAHLHAAIDNALDLDLTDGFGLDA